MCCMSILDKIADIMLSGIGKGVTIFFRFTLFVMKLVFLIGSFTLSYSYLKSYGTPDFNFEGLFFILIWWTMTFLLWTKLSDLKLYYYKKLSIPTIICQQCGHEWAPRDPLNPSTKLLAECPRCHREVSQPSEYVYGFRRVFRALRDEQKLTFS